MAYQRFNGRAHHLSAGQVTSGAVSIQTGDKVMVQTK
jgi:hypothetical protein